MTTRKLSRKIGNQPARTARRPAAATATRRKRKVAAHDDARRFAYWLLVGRFDQDAVEMRYKFTGESTLRCDVPFGAPLTPDALQPYLEDFLESEGTEPDGPPILDGKDN